MPSIYGGIVYEPAIHIGLCELTFKGSIPSCIDIIGRKHNFTPSVYNKHFKSADIAAHGFKYIVQAIIVNGKHIGYIQITFTKPSV